MESLWEYSGHRITKATLNKSLYQATDNEQEEKVKSLLGIGASPDARGDEYVTVSRCLKVQAIANGS